MKKFYSVLIFMCIAMFCSAQNRELECSTFKEGKFMYTNDSSGNVIISRSRKQQVEENSKTGERVKFKIKWTGECEYELKQIWANTKERRKFNRGVNKVIITKTYKDGYEYTCTCKVKEGEKYTGIVHFIK